MCTFGYWLVSMSRRSNSIAPSAVDCRHKRDRGVNLLEWSDVDVTFAYYMLVYYSLYSCGLFYKMASYCFLRYTRLLISLFFVNEPMNFQIQF